MLCLNHSVKFLVFTTSVFWLLVTSNSSATADELTIQISDGEILGSQFVSSWTNKTVYAFKGIPFASPPIGELRFKHPVPPAKWSGTKNCTSFGAYCPQAFMPGASEDCLFLNVYSPELKPVGALAPVYVWIHGGGFTAGAGSWFGPDPMVAEGVVVVTVNYRLGALGFLTLGTSDMPGNGAVFDQILAMKWVQKEISKFGGDPNRVTIGGESAGSMMSHLHYISPASKGLFHAVIAESGTGLVYMAPADAPSYGLELARLVNCSTVETSISDIQMCLRWNVSVDALLSNQDLNHTGYLWVPVVDKDTNPDNPFLPAVPAELVAQGQGSAVPILMGNNRDEGSVGYRVTQFDQVTKNIDYYMRDFILPEVLTASSNASTQAKIDKLKASYQITTDTSNENFLRYLKMFGDYNFDYPTAKSARAFYNRASVFRYYFNFNGDFRAKITVEVNTALNTSLVGHCDDVGYLFIVPIFSDQTITDPNSREMITFNRMVRLWTNFMKYRDPTPSSDSLLQNVSWTPVQDNVLSYLEISDNLTMVLSDFRKDIYSLWDDIESMPTASSCRTILPSFFLCCLFSLLLQI